MLTLGRSDSWCSDFTAEQVRVIWSSSLTTSLLSFFGSSFMLATMLSIGRGSRFTRLLACLAWANYLWSLSVWIPTAYALNHSEFSDVPCLLFRGFFQMAAGSSMCWTLCVAIYMNLVLFGCPIHSVQMWLGFSLFSGAFPVVLFCVLLVLPHSMVRMCEFCFPRTEYNIVFWILPNMLVFLVCTAAYVCILYKVSGLSTVVSTRGIEMPKRITFYILAFLLCWVWEWIAYMVSVAKDTKQTSPLPFVLVVIYAGLPHLQGFFHCLVYIISNVQLHDHFAPYPWPKRILYFFVAPILLWVYVVPKWVIKYFTDENYQLETFDPRIGQASSLIRERETRTSNTESTTTDQQYDSISGKL